MKAASPRLLSFCYAKNHLTMASFYCKFKVVLLRFITVFISLEFGVWSVELFQLEEIGRQENTVKFKSKKFSVRIVNLYKFLCDEKKEYVLSKQVLRSGTSIGANIAESECAISEKDFLSKIYIALKECVETIYWLDLLFETGYITTNEYISIKTDCEEIKKCYHHQQKQ
ncbi:MAG: four helix bundle protein [Acutalibacteraceae bacterium]